MTDKYVITTSGDQAGEDLKEKLNDLDYDIEEVVESEVILTIEGTDGDLSEDLQEIEADNNSRDSDRAAMSVPCLDTSTKLFDFLKTIYHEGPVTNEGLVEMTDYATASGTANDLWNRGLIDRTKDPGTRAYRFEISEKGERELRHHTQ